MKANIDALAPAEFLRQHARSRARIRCWPLLATPSLQSAETAAQSRQMGFRQTRRIRKPEESRFPSAVPHGYRAPPLSEHRAELQFGKGPMNSVIFLRTRTELLAVQKYYHGYAYLDLVER